MNNDIKLAITIGSLLILGFMVFAALMMTARNITDEYCRTIPLERMDKVRCGLEEPKDNHAKRDER